MNKPLIFLYPHGGGGSWLNNLIFNLENNVMELNKVSKVFDNLKKSSIRFSKKLDYFEKHIVTIYDFDEYSEKVFCSKHPFNLYLNEANKVQLHLLKIDKKNFNEQFNILTSSAHGQITDINFKKYYYNNVDLDISLAFTDSDRFIDDLFFILDEHNIIYTKNRDYCKLSIENYKSTCLNPDTIIGNMESIFWLAWCHALKMIHKIPLTISFNFIEADNIDSISTALFPIQEQCQILTKPLYYSWKNA